MKANGIGATWLASKGLVEGHLPPTGGSSRLQDLARLLVFLWTNVGQIDNLIWRLNLAKSSDECRHYLSLLEQVHTALNDEEGGDRAYRRAAALVHTLDRLRRTLERNAEKQELRPQAANP